MGTGPFCRTSRLVVTLYVGRGVAIVCPIDPLLLDVVEGDLRLRPIDYCLYQGCLIQRKSQESRGAPMGGIHK
eukprot:8997039-Pyramimonas_sp.AAC.1